METRLSRTGLLFGNVMNKIGTPSLLPALLSLWLMQPALAQQAPDDQSGGKEDLAQELTNPLANLVTIPLQMNYDSGIGPEEQGSRVQINIQPVYPFSLGSEWNLISRTIVPLTCQEDIFPEAGSQFGLGDINLSLFLSPAKPTSGVIWGAGPVLLLPTATDSLIGGKKWGAGPSAVVLTMRGPWTVGALANHIWSYAGDSERADIDNTFLQPFVAYTSPSAWTFSLQSECSYNWESESWSVPVNVAISKLVRLGRLPVSLQAGVGHWLESPEGAADGWRFRLQANFVLPKPR